MKCTRSKAGSAATRKDLGLLALRAGTGGVLFAHGAQKVFGWFGGPGLEATAEAMHQMGFRPGRQAAAAAGAGEAGGGLLLALGLATPAAGAAAAGAMAGAVAVHAPAGFFAMSGGYEYPAFLGFTAAALGLTGPGRYSVDQTMNHCFNRPWIMLASFAGAAVAASAVVASRARVQSEEAGGAEEPDAAPASTAD
ncbi:DoxX family membrane protein [Streptomyces sp. HNM0574]|uniref:DoxX family protein n=1 Tax=Streptomyces sp. HNM0574 TaxID=2714954 RepID=UPI00146CA19E|nr:DoxX family membrane protein [Streptomyces sp. HNM0574]NLU70598.1 DoxX family membrane protein [Streptomyces sp. HNM0574]